MKETSGLVPVSVMMIFLLTGCLQESMDDDEEKPAFKSTVKEMIILQEQGGRASWLHSGTHIAFDRMEKDGYFDAYVIKPNGSGLRCLTCDKKGVPQLNNGNPSWHPSGEYMVFQAQDAGLEGLQQGKMGDYLASPGVGMNNNLWITDASGSRFWQLTHVRERYGTLHPQFSNDGKKLLWSEIENLRGGMVGHWAMKLADFEVGNGEPRISNIRTLNPLSLQFYETHGFSPDGKKILFSGVEEGKYYYDMEIYVMDLGSGTTTRLTDNDEWDEHAHFTPDGKSIVWTSSEGTPQLKGKSWEDTSKNPPKLEYWMMKADGSNKRQLSGFNNPSAPEYVDIEGGTGLGDFDFGPDGKTIVSKMRKGRGSEMLVLIVLNYSEKKVIA